MRHGIIILVLVVALAPWSAFAEHSGDGADALNQTTPTQPTTQTPDIQRQQNRTDKINSIKDQVGKIGDKVDDVLNSGKKDNVGDLQKEIQDAMNNITDPNQSDYQDLLQKEKDGSLTPDEAQDLQSMKNHLQTLQDHYAKISNLPADAPADTVPQEERDAIENIANQSPTVSGPTTAGTASGNSGLTTTLPAFGSSAHPVTNGTAFVSGPRLTGPTSVPNYIPAIVAQPSGGNNQPPSFPTPPAPIVQTGSEPAASQNPFGYIQNLVNNFFQPKSESSEPTTRTPEGRSYAPIAATEATLASALPSPTLPPAAPENADLNQFISPDAPVRALTSLPEIKMDDAMEVFADLKANVDRDIAELTSPRAAVASDSDGEDTSTDEPENSEEVKPRPSKKDSLTIVRNPEIRRFMDEMAVGQEITQNQTAVGIVE